MSLAMHFFDSDQQYDKRKKTWIKLVEIDIVSREMSSKIWDLARRDISGIDLDTPDLSGNNLQGAKLIGADLTGANLFGANLCNVNQNGAILTRTDLRESSMIAANLMSAILNGACIENANLSGWIIKDIVCTYTIEKTTTYRLIQFAPSEFEKRYTL